MKDELQQSSFGHSSPDNQVVGVLSLKLPLYFQVYWSHYKSSSMLRKENLFISG